MPFTKSPYPAQVHRIVISLWYGLLAAGLFLVAPVSLAQTDDAQRAQARASFNAGVDKYAAEDFSGALAAFQEAYRLRPHPSVRVNMANCYERLSRPVEALFHFESFLQESGVTVSAAQRTQVQEAIVRLRGQIGQIIFNVAPETAEISVDEQALSEGSTNRPMRFAAGLRRIRISQDGFQSFSVELNLRPGVTEQVNARLERVVVGIVAPPAVPIVVDERARSESAEALERQARHEERQQDVQHESGVSAAVWVTGALAIALAGGATATGLMALNANDDFDAAVTDSKRAVLSTEERAALVSDGKDAADQANTLALVTDILIGASIAAAASSVLIYVLSDGTEEPDAGLRAVTPWLTPSSNGLAAGGLSLQGAW